MIVLDRPIVLAYAGISPAYDASSSELAPGAALLGRATLGRNARLGLRSVIRADGHDVAIGENFHLGAHGTVHIAHDVLGTTIGSNVTAGDGAVIHACEVADDCFVGAGTVILDGSRIGRGAAFAPGTIVFPRSELEGGFLYEGMPAKPVRRLEPGELERLHAECHASCSHDAIDAWPDRPRSEGHVFVAANARIRGAVVCGGANGIWYGCDLDAGSHAIEVGANTNIQDNTTISAQGKRVAIGRDSTIGHNVTMVDCTVGDRSLVGIGAVVAAGTRIGDDVLLAAGATTQEGQVLEDGSFYGGRPARRLGDIGDAKKALIAGTWPTYCDYAKNFDRAQQQHLRSSADLTGAV